MQGRNGYKEPLPVTTIYRRRTQPVQQLLLRQTMLSATGRAPPLQHAGAQRRQARRRGRGRRRVKTQQQATAQKRQIDGARRARRRRKGGSAARVSAQPSGSRETGRCSVQCAGEAAHTPGRAPMQHRKTPAWPPAYAPPPCLHPRPPPTWQAGAR